MHEVDPVAQRNLSIDKNFRGLADGE